MKSIKKMLIAFLLLCIMAFSVAGCGNKEVIVATINGESISEQLYRINLWSTQRGLEATQENYWNFENIEGKSPEEYAKAKTLKAITYCIVVQQKAEELNIKKLTKEEKARIKEAAKAEMKAKEAFAKEYGITKKDYEEYYTFAIQNEKVASLLAQNYEPNASEVAAKIDEMKMNGESLEQADIIHILIKTKNELGEEIPKDKKEEAYQKAQEVLEKALAGEDMNVLASQYSEDPSVSENLGNYSFTRGDELGEEIDQVVFEKAKINAVYPEVVETDMGYEVIKVLNREDKSKEHAIELIKSDCAKRELEEATNFAEVQTTEAYDAIRVGPMVTSENESIDKNNR